MEWKINVHVDLFGVHFSLGEQENSFFVHLGSVTSREGISMLRVASNKFVGLGIIICVLCSVVFYSVLCVV